MQNLNVSKEMISNIAEQENKKFLNNTNKLVNYVVGSALKDLSEKVSFLSLKNIVLQPVNELISGAFIDGSDFIYLLGIQNVQLELNTSRKSSFWKRFKDRIKWAWENRKTFIKKRKRRKKKEKEKNINLKSEEINFNPSKYTIYDLSEDLQNTVAKYLSETSLIYLNRNLLQIVGKDDFGSNTKIYIYVVSYDGTLFKYYNEKKKVYVNINIDERVKHLEEKIKAVGDNFVKILKIFNAMYYNTNGNMCNQIFMESILCSCPEDLYFGDDIYKVFVKIINYLSIRPIKDVKSINDTNLTIFKDEVCSNNILGFNKMMNKILYNK